MHKIVRLERVEKIVALHSALLAAHFSHMSQRGTDSSIKLTRFGPRARETQREPHVSALLPKKAKKNFFPVVSLNGGFGFLWGGGEGGEGGGGGGVAAF